MKLNQNHFIRLKIFWNFPFERTHESIKIIEIGPESESIEFIIENN